MGPVDEMGRLVINLLALKQIVEEVLTKFYPRHLNRDAPDFHDHVSTATVERASRPLFFFLLAGLGFSHFILL